MKLFPSFLVLVAFQATAVAKARVTPPHPLASLRSVREIPRGGGAFRKKQQTPSSTPLVPVANTGGTATIPNEVFNLVKNIVGKDE